MGGWEKCVERGWEGETIEIQLWGGWEKCVERGVKDLEWLDRSIKE